ncbi:MULTISPECIES: OprD family porin [Pseudomonas]|uniref:Porin n=2 Tax=Pseudomonas putida group TaxID=136845 RepID=V9V3M5_9PSED|nr:porin [Pseudomonas putida S16]AHC84125.1 porin [Pseudomonas monteilii SB3078]AHC89496.1 porin [Pseudomonas monteilii SB3101]KGK27082.1 porin [Pseudomonas plecoglossicida]QJQ12290.1 OprD family porin [Pseudomonas putida]
MKTYSMALVTSICTPGLITSQIASAELIKDSKASVEARNFYFNRDLHDTMDAQQSKREEWAQGFILKAESGYTSGAVGFGLDAYAGLGLKLDSSDERAGTNLLPSKFGDDGPGGYSETTVTLKAKISKTAVKLGGLMPRLPTVTANDSRLLPQNFLGGHVNSQEIAGLNFDVGQIRKVNQQDSSDFQDLSLNSVGGRRNFKFGSNGNQGEDFSFGGVSYKWHSGLTTAYNYGELEKLYKQHILNMTYVLPIASNQSLKSDLRYAYSTDDGGSNVDNRAFGAMLSYSLSGHILGLGYQRMSGDTGYAYLNGAGAFLVNYVQIGDFASKDEFSWQARYDFDFASVGVPGLTFMTRYIRGTNIDQGTGLAEGKEWERNMDIVYVVQQGPLKNLMLKWRNATVRNNFANDFDENRLILSYTVSLY